jgi:tRNA nucleotidyltransferase/poly(A) polymerase
VFFELIASLPILVLRLSQLPVAILKQHVKLLGRVARERISYEFFTLMNCQKVARLVVEMGEIGLLEEIYPELKDCRRVTANSFHHLALFDH